MKFNPKSWLIAESVDGGETYLFHREVPVFLAQVFDEEDSPAGGLTLALNNGQVLANIEWFDQPVTGTSKLGQIITCVSKALDAYDAILAVDLRQAIRDEMDEEGYTLSNVSQMSGVAVSTISDYLSGKHEISSGKLGALLEALDLSIR